MGDPAVTKKTCPLPPNVAEAEQRYLSILKDVGSYPMFSVDGGMRLETKDGRAIVFTAPD